MCSHMWGVCLEAMLYFVMMRVQASIFNALLKIHFIPDSLYFLYFLMFSPIRSLIESGFSADKRSDVRLYYGVRNLQRMAYQV